MTNSIEFRAVTNKDGTKTLQYRCLQFEEVTEVDFVDGLEYYALKPIGWSEWLDHPLVT